MLNKPIEMLYMELLMMSTLIIGILLMTNASLYKIDIKNPKTVMLLSTMTMALFEVLWEVCEEGQNNEILLYVVVGAFQAIQAFTIVSTCWMLLSEFEVKISSKAVESIVFSIPIVVSILLSLSSRNNEFYYYINDEFCTCFGPLYQMEYQLQMGYLVATLGVIIASYITNADSRTSKKEMLRVFIAYNAILIGMILVSENLSNLEYSSMSLCFALSACFLNAYLNTKKLAMASAQEAENEADLGIATEIQTGMLPDISEILGERKEVEVAASMNPAREVGGDFFDVFYKDPDHLVLTIADVSGKGIPAAFFMSVSMNLLRNGIKSEESLEEAFFSVNNSLCTGNDLGMFVTVWTGILEISTGKMQCVNAGHEFPVIKRDGRAYELLKDKHGLALGVMEGMNYEPYEIDLEPKEAIFVYTDGVAEANNENHDMYGTDNLLNTLNEIDGLPQQDLIVEVKKSVDAFAGEAQQFDDITMLGFKYYGEEK